MSQIVALIIGLVLYYVLSKKDKKKTKPEQGPDQVMPPIRPKPAPELIPEPEPEPAPMPMMDEDFDDDDDDGLSYKPVTFEELLKQFGNDGKKQSQQDAWKRREEAARKQAARSVVGIDEEFIPAVPDMPKASGQVHSLLTAEDLMDKRDENFKIGREAKSYYAKLLQDPQTLRDVMVMKEILDRKHFEI